MQCPRYLCSWFLKNTLLSAILCVWKCFSNPSSDSFNSLQPDTEFPSPLPVSCVTLGQAAKPAHPSERSSYLVHADNNVHLTGLGFPDGSNGKESACNAGDPGSVPGLGRSPREGNGNPLQYSCLENSMVRGAWWATVQGVTKSWTQLRHFAFTGQGRG